MLVTSNAPDAFVVFYPFEVEDVGRFNNKTPASEFMKTKEPVIAKTSIMAISTSKSKGSPGTFQITLASDKNWKGIVQPGSWCAIYISDYGLTTQEKSEYTSGLKMIGIVRSVRRSERTAGESGTRMVHYTVSGEDFQSVFNSMIYLNQNLLAGPQEPAVLALITAIRKYSGVETNPTGAVKLFINLFLGPTNIQVGRKGDVSTHADAIVAGRPPLVPAALSERILGKAAANYLFTAFVAFFLQKDLVGHTIPTPQLGGKIPVWGLMQAFMHGILNELYTDLLPVSINGQTRLLPSLIHRALPFSSDQPPSSSCIPFRSAVAREFQGSGFAAPVKAGTAAHYYVSKVIGENEIHNLDHGKSDVERYNFFFVTASMATDKALPEADLVGKIVKGAGFSRSERVINSPSVSRYGLRPQVEQSIYYPKGTDTINRIVRDMWADAYLFENGTVTLTGTWEHIPVGTNILFKDRGWVAHVEHVTNQFMVLANGAKVFRTNVSFVRLQNADGTPIDVDKTDGQLAHWDRGLSS